MEAIDVNGTMVYVTRIEIIDISLGGLSMRADRRLNIDCSYIIKLQGQKKTISLKGAVIWSKLSEIKKRPDGKMSVLYTAGMQFNDVSASIIPDLQEFIWEHRRLAAVSLDDYRTSELRSRVLTTQPAGLPPQLQRIK